MLTGQCLVWFHIFTLFPVEIREMATHQQTPWSQKSQNALLVSIIHAAQVLPLFGIVKPVILLFMLSRIF